MFRSRQITAGCLLFLFVFSFALGATVIDYDEAAACVCAQCNCLCPIGAGMLNTGTCFPAYCRISSPCNCRWWACDDN